MNGCAGRLWQTAAAPRDQVRTDRAVGCHIRLDYWRGLAGDPGGPAALVFGGDQSYVRGMWPSIQWRDL